VEESVEDEEPALAALHEAMVSLGVSRPSGYDHRKALFKVQDQLRPSTTSNKRAPFADF
jgi:hypothetical protein